MECAEFFVASVAPFILGAHVWTTVCRVGPTCINPLGEEE